MFSTIKNYIGVGLSAIVAVLFGLLKWKSGQLKQAEQTVLDQQKKIELELAKKAATEVVHKQYKETMRELEDHYDEETIKQFEDYDDKPLSPSLLERLRNKEGSGGNTNTPTE